MINLSNVSRHNELKTSFPAKVRLFLLRRVVCALVISLILGVGTGYSTQTELTQAQAVARVRSILRNNTTGCQINKINGVSAGRVKAGWRVTAKIVMSASGSQRSETAVWIVSQRNGAAAQSQLASEIENGCP